MDRPMPGSMPIEGREFMYLEGQGAEAFAKVFPTLVSAGGDPKPKHGGMLNEAAVIKLPTGKWLHGVSYKGDLKGWRRSLIAACQNLGSLWGEVVEGRVRLSNGQEYSLDECIVEVS